LRTRVHDRAGDVVDAVVVDLPLHAGGAQHHRKVGALHLESPLDRGDTDRGAAEVRAGCELHGGGGAAADDPHQVGTARAGGGGHGGGGDAADGPHRVGTARGGVVGQGVGHFGA